jgi:hypothetical protein
MCWHSFDSYGCSSESDVRPLHGSLEVMVFASSCLFYGSSSSCHSWFYEQHMMMMMMMMMKMIEFLYIYWRECFAPFDCPICCILHPNNLIFGLWLCPLMIIIRWGGALKTRSNLVSWGRTKVIAGLSLPPSWFYTTKQNNPNSRMSSLGLVT